VSRDEETDHLLRQARQARTENRLADARRDLFLAIELLRREGARMELAQALRDLGEMERRLPDGDAARRHYEESVAIFREMGEPLRLAHTVRHLGDVHYAAGRADLAEPCFHEALALYRGHEHAPPLDLANAIRSLAVLKDDAGDADEARRLWQEAHDLYAALGVAEGVAGSAARIARLAPRQREP
jgi:tetratricopeptide (TPR) repeat protein